jgi:hypothetical protein
MGHNTHQMCIDFLKKKQKDWSDVKIIVFDSPQEIDKPFSERLNILNQSLLFLLIDLIFLLKVFLWTIQS